VNGQPAPISTQVEARGLGVLPDEECNPITVIVAGRYGGPTMAELKLCVQGTIAEGAPIEFYVDGVRAQCAPVVDGVQGPSWMESYPFQSGVVTELNLRVGGGTPTFTPTSTVAPTATSRPKLTDDIVATATRRTPQAPTSTGAVTSSPTAPAPESAASPVASANAPRNAVVATPTTPAAPGGMAAATPSATPTLQPTAVSSPTATPVTPTARPTSTLTPALLARAPRATSNPILEPGTALPTAQATVPSTSSSGGAASGRTLALGGGLAALVMAIAAGVLIGVRARSR
jgi:hypothetical protein